MPMDARDIEKLVTKAKDDIIKEVHDKLPRKVGVVAVNHFKQNFRDGVKDPLPYADTIGCFSPASFPFQGMECKFQRVEYEFHGLECIFQPMEQNTFAAIITISSAVKDLSYCQKDKSLALFEFNPFRHFLE